MVTARVLDNLIPRSFSSSMLSGTWSVMVRLSTLSVNSTCGQTRWIAVVNVGNNAEISDIFAGHQVFLKSFQILQTVPVFFIYAGRTRRYEPHTIYS